MRLGWRQVEGMLLRGEYTAKKLADAGAMVRTRSATASPPGVGVPAAGGSAAQGAARLPRVDRRESELLRGTVRRSLPSVDMTCSSQASLTIIKEFGRIPPGSSLRVNMSENMKGTTEFEKVRGLHLKLSIRLLRERRPSSGLYDPPRRV